MKRYFIILGGSNDQLFMIKTAHKMGLKTIVFDGNSQAPGLKLATISANIDFSKLDLVYEFINRCLKEDINICGISTMGSDVPHLLAEISEKYNWVGPTIDTGYLTTDKYMMKKKLEKNGIPVPRFSLVTKYNEIKNIWNNWDCDKIIIKPIDRAGSRGVRIINDIINVEKDFNHAMLQSNNKKVMIEEYIDGPQISTESIIYNEYKCTPGFADRVYDNMNSFHPQIMENGGWVPSAHPKETIEAVKKVVEKASLILGINKGVSKGDVVLDAKKGPMIIEIASRLSGGDFCESLVPLSSSMNYVVDVIKIAIGQIPDMKNLEKKYTKAVANRYFFLPYGKLEKVDGIDLVKDIPEVQKIDLYFKIGDSIPKIESHSQRAGLFIIVCNNRKSAQEKIDYIYSKVNFKVDGKWFSGDPKSYKNN